MKPAPIPDNEAQRLEALHRYEVLDSDFERAFDELTELASEICETPITLISLVDQDRQWFKSTVGLDVRETSRETAFCAHAIHGNDIFTVADARQDERFADNPLVTGAPSIRFYAGAPLITTDGLRLGTLCAIDSKPRTLTPFQERALKTLSRQVMDQLELRLSLRELEARDRDNRELLEAKDKMFAMISHDLRSPIGGIQGMTEVLAMELEDQDMESMRESVSLLDEASRSTLELLNNLLDWSRFETGNLKFRPEAIDLRTTIDQEITSLSALANGKNIQLTVNAPAKIKVVADEAMISCALRNLLSNAIKFTPEGKSVSLQVTEVGDQWSVEVLDQGIGMSEEQMRGVTKPEVRKGTVGESSSGLGLSLVQRFLRHHDSALELESNTDGGTRASFKLRP
ncbi:MAG: GAF domain-containing sensor histidine kinase [Gammaproteobacteria bacterium]